MLSSVHICLAEFDNAHSKLNFPFGLLEIVFGWSEDTICASIKEELKAESLIQN